jgi:hypothetical protein
MRAAGQEAQVKPGLVSTYPPEVNDLQPSLAPLAATTALAVKVTGRNFGDDSAAMHLLCFAETAPMKMGVELEGAGDRGACATGFLVSDSAVLIDVFPAAVSTVVWEEGQQSLLAWPSLRKSY